MENVILKLPESKGKNIGYKVSGKINKLHETAWLRGLDQLIEDHEKINLLLWFTGDAWWEPDAGIEDMMWVFKNAKHMKKIAVVSGKNFWKWFTALDRPFAKLFGIEEKFFGEDELEKAWAWLKAETMVHG